MNSLYLEKKKHTTLVVDGRSGPRLSDGFDVKLEIVG